MKKLTIILFLLINIIFANENKELSIAYNIGNPPLKFLNNKNMPDGILIDVWKLWSKKTGIKINFKEAPFSKTVDLVKNGEINVHAGLFYTEDREKFLDYTNRPILDIKYYIFHHKDIHKIDNFESLKAYVIGVPEGYTHKFVKEHLEGATIKVYKNFPELYEAARNGEIKTFISPKMNLEYFLRKHNYHNQWRLSSEKYLYKRNYYAAVKQNDFNTLKLINDGFSKISPEEVDIIEKKWLKKTIKQNKEKNTYIVSVDGNYAPFSMINSQGKPAGILIDFWKLWAKKQNVDVQFLFNNWNDSIKAVEDGIADFHSGFESNYDWAISSHPYLQINAKIFYPKNGVKKDIKYFFGKRLATISSYYKALIENEFPRIEVVLVSSYSDYFNMLTNKKISGFIDDEISINDLLLKQGRQGEFLTLSGFTTSSIISAVTNKKNKSVLNKINKGLEKITISEKYKILDNWIKDPKSALLLSERKELKRKNESYKSLKLKFTKEEKEWLLKNSTIKLAFMNNWPTDDQNNSIHSDLLKLLNEYSNLNFVPAIFESWDDAFSQASKGDNVYGIMNLSWSKEREKKYFYYTKPYDFSPSYLITKKSNDTLKSLEDLKNKTIYLNENEISHKTIEDLPYKINVIDVKNDKDMMKKLFTLDESQGGLTYSLNPIEFEKHNLKVVKHIYDKYGDVSIGISHKNKPLKTIINKIYDSIPQNEMVKLRSKVYKKSQSVSTEFFETLQKKKMNTNEILQKMLTKEEKKWLEDNPRIKVAFVKEWESDNEGNNIHTEVIRLLNKYSDLHFLPAKYKTWSEAFDEATRGNDVHAMMNLSWSKEREKNNFLYTKSYDIQPGFLITKKDNTDIHSLNDLKNKTVYLKEKVISHKVIEELPFKVDVIDLKTDFEMIQKLSTLNEAQAGITYTVYKDELAEHGLKVVKHLYDKYADVSMGVSHKHKPLQSIVNKVYKIIPKSEMVKIRNKNYSRTKESTLFDSLSLEEINWIKNNPTIKIANELDWLPFDYNQMGTAKGISVDMIKEILSRLNLKGEFVSGNWAELLEKFKNKEIDLIHPLIKTKEREKFTLFTKPHIKLNNVLIVRSNEENIKTLEDLKKRKLAIAKGWANHELLKKNYPKIKFIEVSGTKEGLEAVANNKADAYTDTLTTAEYIIKKNFMSNLKIIYDSDSISELGLMQLRLGVRDDWPIFYNLIKKGLDSLSPKDIEAIYLNYGLTFNDLTPKIFLSKKENNWLKNNDYKIKACVDPNWMPFEMIDSEGRYLGMGSDYMKMFEKKLGNTIEIQNTKSWTDSLNKIKNKECDIISLAMKTPQRDKFMNFTSSYLSFPLVIATRNDELYIDNFKNVLDKSFAIVKGYAVEDIVRKNNPDMNVIEVDNVKDGLEKVSKGEVFGFIDTIASISYEIQKSRLVNLKISGMIEDTIDLSVAVRDDSPELLSIFQKLIDSITEEEALKISSKWISVKIEKAFDYDLLWKIVVFSLLIIFAFIYWNRKLADQVKLRIKAEEEAKNASEAKSLFLARMSHEIRTPMNAILGMLYLVQKTELSPIQQNYIEKSKNSAESLLRIINDILDFSKIEAGKLQIDNQEFNFHKMIDEVSSIMSFKSEEKGLELLIEYDTNIPKFLVADPIRIQQVLINLIGNAIKFTSEGEIVLTIKSIENENNKITLMFCVSDNGIGISKQNQNKLFKEFSQVDGSITRKFGGTGLGLAISNKLSNLMGGKVWLEDSEYNKGSVFCFTIKCDVPKQNNYTMKFFPKKITDICILVVDDNKVAAKMLCYSLKSLNLSCDTVFSGEEAIERLLNTKCQYDIVFMDYNMSKLNGIDTYKILKDNLKDKLPKVVIAIGHKEEQYIDEIERSGINTFVIKPISPSILYDLIIQVVNESNIKSYDNNVNDKNISIESIAHSHILLVEDNEINQEFATILLEENSIIVDIANDGLKAIDMIKTKKYDCVLMDIQMPNMDGIEATKKIREMIDETNYFKNVPIIAMTAHAMSGDKEKSIKAGMNDHITKPINPDKLFSSLLNFIEPKQNASIKTEKKKVSIFDVIEENEIIDIKSALNRINGNQLGLLNILKKFSNKYYNIANEIKVSIENNNFLDAKEKVHKIKGMSSNISAKKLYSISIEIDKMLINNEKPTSELLDKYVKSLNEVVNFIDRLKDENEIEKKEYNEMIVIKLLQDIDNNLEKDISISQEKFQELLLYLTDEKYKEFINKLDYSLSNFDTDEVSKLVKMFLKNIKG